MTASWVSRTVRWPTRAGIGLAHSVILLVVSVLYPAAWALGAWLVWLEASVGHGSMAVAVELALFGGIVCLVGASPICGLLRVLVRRWTGTTVADGYRPAASIVRMSTGYWWNGRRYFRFLGLARVNRWVHRRLRGPAAWRDRRALVAAPFGVGVVAAVPVPGVVAGIAVLARATRRSAWSGCCPSRWGSGHRRTRGAARCRS